MSLAGLIDGDQCSSSGLSIGLLALPPILGHLCQQFGARVFVRPLADIRIFKGVPPADPALG